LVIGSQETGHLESRRPVELFANKGSGLANMTIDEENGTTVLRRTPDYVPRPSWRTWLIGRPLPTADAPHQTVRKIVGLAIFASDAVSSTAHATQKMLVVLAAAGTAAFGLAFPISVAGEIGAVPSESETVISEVAVQGS
jgi:hypothetical protein